MSTTQKVALITGAGSGIGRAAALALAADGWSLALAGRRIEPLQETARGTRERGVQAIAVATDVGDPESVRNLFAKVREVFGRLDLLFNNAGTGGPPRLLEELTYEQWKGVVDTNLTGAFLCTQEAFKITKEQTPRAAGSSTTARSPPMHRVPIPLP